MGAVPKLRFPEFEGEWLESKLSELAELTSSKRVSQSQYVNHGVPFFRGKEISELNSGKFPNDILYISEISYKEFKSKFGAPSMGDILITAVGTLANTYHVSSNFSFYFKDGNLIWLRNVILNSQFLEITLVVNKPKILKLAIGSSQ